MTPLPPQTRIFFHFRVFLSVTKNSRFSARFPLRNEGVTGAKIAPRLEGYQVLKNFAHVSNGQRIVPRTINEPRLAVGQTPCEFFGQVN